MLVPSFQRSTSDYCLVASEDVAVGEGGRGVDEFCLAEWPGGIDEVGAADLAITLRRELSENQIAFIGEKDGWDIFAIVALSPSQWSDVDARAIFRGGDAVGAPDLLAGGGFQADEIAVAFGRVDIVTLQQRSGGVA